MRKNILLLVSVLFLLGIGMAFANNAGRTITRTAMSCCCKGDSCPMKNKDKSSADGKSAAKCDCCTGDSCPMKNKDAASADAKSCCDNCDCCKGDECPMKMKGDHKDGMTMPMAMDAGSGDAKTCDCSCCHDKDAKTEG